MRWLGFACGWPPRERTVRQPGETLAGVVGPFMRLARALGRRNSQLFARAPLAQLAGVSRQISHCLVTLRTSARLHKISVEPPRFLHILPRPFSRLRSTNERDT